MKKLVFLLMMLLMLVGQSAVAIAATDIPQVIRPDGFEVHESLIIMKDDRVYVSLGIFNSFNYVTAFEDFGGTGLWSPEKDTPGQKTSVALLEQSNESRNVTIVVNKTTGEVLIEARGSVPAVHPDLDAIIVAGKVYLPLRATSDLLGATVDYDSSSNTVTVNQL